MKTVAICNSEFRKNEACVDFVDFKLFGQNIPVAVLDVEEDFNFIPDDAVLVKILAFSCNYRDKSVMLNFNETCKERAVSGSLCYLPFGSEFVGQVVDFGSTVKEFCIGDRVMINAAYPFKPDGTLGGLPTNCASQRMHLFKQCYLKKVPDEMSDEKAVAFTIAAQTSYSMIRKLELCKGQNILVTAATSNTSLASILLLRNKHVNISVCSSTDEHKEKLIQMGVDNFILKSDLLADSFITSKDFKRFDAVIDPFSDIYSHRLIDYMNYGGKYVTCGVYSQNLFFEEQESTPYDLLRLLTGCISKNVAIIGNCLGHNEDLDDAIIDYKKGIFDIVIDSVWKSDLSSFLDRTFNQHSRFGKVIYKYED